MTTHVERHYAGSSDLAAEIRNRLVASGRGVNDLTSADLAAVDEFHIRGRQATLELADRMALTPASRVLDLGSGLGGPSRTLAETYGCTVTGVDLTQSFCTAAAEMSDWLGLSNKVEFVHGDATDPPFEPGSFDAAMSIHVAMNIPAKDALYAAAKRMLRPDGIFAVYDVLQGEGGQVQFPVPWAREASISHLATPSEMRELLEGAGFEVLDESDSSEESLNWFKEMAARMEQAGPPPVSLALFLGDDFREMAKNQVRNLVEQRIRTVSYICRA